MSSDPTKEEILEFLADYCRLGDIEEGECKIAAYWFAQRYHHGQSSNLYRVLCNSSYQPGPMGDLIKEGPVVQLLFCELEEEYVTKRNFN